MELPEVGSSTPGLESPEQSTQQVLAVHTHTPSTLTSAVSCGTGWRTQGACNPECNSFLVRAGVEVREPDRLEERRRQGWKMGGGQRSKSKQVGGSGT